MARLVPRLVPAIHVVQLPADPEPSGGSRTWMAGTSPAMTPLTQAGPIASAVHHIGVSVANLDDALAFWESWLGRRASWRTILDRPYLARHVGIAGVSIEAAFIDLPGRSE